MKPGKLVDPLSVKLLRIMHSGIFLVAGMSHLIKVDQTVNRIGKSTFKEFAYFFGNPEILVILSGVVMLIAGFSLLIGFKTRWAAAVLIMVLIPITLTVQVGQITTIGPLFKNIAILSGLLFFIINDFKNPLKTNL